MAIDDVDQRLIQLLRTDARMTIFILARTVGWLAHMLEQAATGQLIRPRARYSGQTVTNREPLLQMHTCLPGTARWAG